MLLRSCFPRTVAGTTEASQRPGQQQESQEGAEGQALYTAPQAKAHPQGRPRRWRPAPRAASRGATTRRVAGGLDLGRDAPRQALDLARGGGDRQSCGPELVVDGVVTSAPPRRERDRLVIVVSQQTAVDPSGAQLL